MCTCDEGYTGQNGLVCRPCAEGTFKNYTGDGRCTSCTIFGDPQLGSDTGMSMCGCKRGWDGPPSVPLPRSGNCSACPRGRYKGFVGGFGGNCSLCPRNTYSNLSGVAQCLPCRVFSESPEGSLSQLNCSCFPGYTLGPTGPIPNSTTNATYNDSCVACPTGMFKNSSGPSLCENCTAGSYTEKAGSGYCNVCPPLTTGPVASKSFLNCKCQPGYSGIDAFNCSACPPETYKPDVSFTPCTPCPLQSSNGGGTGNTTCTCNPGFTLDYSKTVLTCKACTGKFQCPNGQYWRTCTPLRDAGCEKCANGTTNANHSRPTHGEEGPAACICDKGYTGQREPGGPCSLCPADTYKPDISNAPCTRCRENLTSYPGSVSILSCSCVPGQTFECPPDGPCEVDPKDCEKCPAGSFKERLEPVPCDPCPPGTWQNETGMSSCKSCPSNSNTSGYSASKDIAQCICDTGYTGSDGGPCTACAAGTYKNVTGAQTCKSCKDGVTFQDVPGSTACRDCLPTERCADGLYWRTCPTYEDGRCAQCSNNKPPASVYIDHGRPLNVNMCAWGCKAGYVLTNNECMDCPEGSFVNGGEIPPRCTPCPYPSTTGGTGSAFCTLCSAGFYLLTYGLDGHAVCKRCASPHTTTSGGVQSEFASDACKCGPGYDGFSWACAACPAGKYKIGITESSDTVMYFQQVLGPADVCLPCPGGSFGTGTARTSVYACTACPDSSQAYPGADTCL